MLSNISKIIPSLLAVVAVKVAEAENLKCYVCIPNTGSSVAEVTRMFPDGLSLPLCNKFQKDRKEYVRECPSSTFLGCLTQSNGTHITKTCSSIGVEDCKTANKIKYCYCKGQLCNDDNVPEEEATPPGTPGTESSDDEEDTESYAEGSGSPEESSMSMSSKGHRDEIEIEVSTTSTLLTTTQPKAASVAFQHSSLYLPYLTFLILHNML